MKWIQRHQNRIPRNYLPRIAERDGETVALIALSGGSDLIVDLESVAKIPGLCHLSDSGYAKYSVPGTGRSKLVHRLLMSAEHGQIVDHINRNRLDCRLKNMRFVTYSENVRHAGIRRHNRTGFKNVTQLKRKKYPEYRKFQVVISVNGRVKSFGCFDKAEDAAHRADEINLKLFGSLAVLNFPEDERDLYCGA